MVMTLQEVVERYDGAVDFLMKEKETDGKSKQTLVSYAASFKQFRAFFLELHRDDEEVNDPGFLDMQMWRDSLFESGKSVGSVNLRMTHLGILFNAMSDEALGECRVYDRNPVTNRVKPSIRKLKKKEYDQILTDEQVVQLWKNEPQKKYKGWTWPRDYAIIMLFLTTEIRNSELAELRVSDLDFEYAEITVRHGKGDKKRCVEFPLIAQYAVKIYLESGERPKELSDDDYLFGTTYEKRKGACIGTAFGKEEWHRLSRQFISWTVERRVRKITGVPNVSSHDLRHVGARLDLNNGMEPIELQSKLGHSHFQTTEIYCGKLSTKRGRSSAERVFRERDIYAERNKMMLEGAR